jgi:2-keto-4-pentenoate hydratase/2-oxohepta-3-ene-1,7-dioic acid hydratase in catechol pathway
MISACCLNVLVKRRKTLRLVTYHTNGNWQPGIAIDDWIVDAVTAAEFARFPTKDWTSTRNIIQTPISQRTAIGHAARALAESTPTGAGVFSLAEVQLGPPIPDPDKIICMGLNYRSHAKEAGFSAPKVPILFAKYPNALTGPNSPIVLPKMSEEIDYEGELAVVIGRKCKGVTSEEALGYVAGYMAFNDVSSRDLQFRAGQWLSGKTLDTFAPCGPTLVVDEISDPQTLTVQTRVNGQTLQKGHTKDMIFPVAESLAYISQLMTLQPGDIIATGTPEGVGFKRTPPIFLREGDIVEVEIEKIGTLRNPVI